MPNLARGMILSGVNQLWVADITFLHLAEEFAFLAVVLDALSRRVVGWALDTHLRAILAIAALEMAITDHRPAPGGLVHYSDRGFQYAPGARRCGWPSSFPFAQPPGKNALVDLCAGDETQRTQATTVSL
ncbi:DDE-type integrase/transposase/recombinase [Mesorhizobium dulcispinae]|uniref:DDE-type integrase/transposase/recombinase n=1 Tax=Mesorhizobium dulcispinae TaxID=3072316 RepID=A0ABU4XPR7_9HYPH|nr:MULTISPECIES: DDE-type integrase/transposase/recombinase [unclassified Mesorhizobium]MDX8476734.1 DDE-type integrase/transposase/recombinase [Mesorhizobium sp. VK23A]